MPHTFPPYALPPASFRFWHLANLAGRAPIGGAREVALACFVAARLAADSAAPFEESSSRLARSAGAKAWLGTLTLPAPVRAQVTVLADLCVDAQAGMLSRELTVLSVAATPYLDAPSRGELEGLAASLRDSGP